MARPGGGGRPRRRDKGDQVERADRERYYAKPQGQRSGRDNKTADPNSPFAKLAALKQQLEQGSKEGT
jgi:ATP-dependent RNA helicase SUPV3L1/SUV3